MEGLFNKYANLDQEKPGQGIVLFIVHKIVEHFKGTIEIESTPGIGTI